MSAGPIEVLLAHLEGSYEQIDKRLGSIESRLGSMDSNIDSRFRAVEGRFADLDRKIDAVFFRLVALTMGTWVTIMLGVFVTRR